MQEIKKIKDSGKQTNAYTKVERINVGDVDGHMVSLLVSEGVMSTSGDALMDGAQVASITSSDLINYNGPFHGYSKLTKKGNSAVCKFEGKLTTILSTEGTPVMTFEATYFWTKGTGQLENIKGGGTLKGRFLTSIIYTVEWEGEYWIEK